MAEEYYEDVQSTQGRIPVHGNESTMNMVSF